MRARLLRSCLTQALIIAQTITDPELMEAHRSWCARLHAELRSLETIAW